MLLITYREEAGGSSSPAISQACTHTHLEMVVAEVEKLQSAFMHTIASEDAKILNQVMCACTKRLNVSWYSLVMACNAWSIWFLQCCRARKAKLL